MELYMDEKWKLSKKGSMRQSSSSSRREGGSAGAPPYLKRSSSMPSDAAAALAGAGGRVVGAHHHHHHDRCSFTSRCASLVKEQRARFYIVRRCVTMLICWRDYP